MPTAQILVGTEGDANVEQGARRINVRHAASIRDDQPRTIDPHGVTD